MLDQPVGSGVQQEPHRSFTPMSHDRLTRFELRQRYIVAGIFENNFYRHIDVNFVDRAVDDIAAKAGTVVQVNPGGNVRNIRCEAAQGLSDDFANDRERKNFALAAERDPFQFVAGAVAANRSRTKDPGAAVLAFLHHELAGPGSVPERLVDGSDFG